MAGWYVWLMVLAWLLWVNLRAFWLFRIDKQYAAAGMRRVPEAQLLRLAAFGGWFGAKLAQARFRHKTQKQPFAGRLNRIFAVQLLLGALLASPPGIAGLSRLAASPPVQIVQGVGHSIGQLIDQRSGQWTGAGADSGAGGAHGNPAPRRFGPGAETSHLRASERYGLPRRFGPGGD